MSGLSAQFRPRARIFYWCNVRELCAGRADTGHHNIGPVVRVLPQLAVSLGVALGCGVAFAACSCNIPVFSDHLDSPRPLYRPVRHGFVETELTLFAGSFRGALPLSGPASDNTIIHLSWHQCRKVTPTQLSCS